MCRLYENGRGRVMLVLTRKEGESVIVTFTDASGTAHRCMVTVVDTHRHSNAVRIGFTAPDSFNMSRIKKEYTEEYKHLVMEEE